MRIRAFLMMLSAAMMLAATNAQAAEVAYVLQTPGVT